MLSDTIIYSDRFNAMYKNSIKFCGLTVGLGAFGMFFRWLQDQAAFEPDTGLLKPGALNWIVPLAIAVSVFVFFRLIAGLKQKGSAPCTDFYTVFTGESKLFELISWPVGLLMAVGGVALLIGAKGEPMAGVYSVIAVLAVLSGLGFPLALSAPQTRYSPGLVCVLMTFPVVLFTLWVIVSYRIHANVPTVWSYAIEILAIAAALMGFFLAAGYPYGKARPVPTLFALMLGAYLCIMALGDPGSLSMKLILLSAAGMFVMYIWILVLNFYRAEPERTEKPADDSSPVIEPGEAPDEAPEPTIQIYDRKK